MQPFVDVLHVHDGVIHQRADGDGHASQTHGVDGQPHVVQRQQRHHKRQRQGDKGDERGAHVGQEEEQDDDHEDAALYERVLHVADGAFYEAALAEDVGRDLDVGGQVLLQVFQSLLQSLGQLQRTGGGLFGDCQQHGRFAPFGGQTQAGQLGTDTYVGNVLQRHDAARFGGSAHHTALQLLHPVGGQQAAHNVLVAVLIEYSAVGIQVHAPRGGQHLIQ